MISPVNQTIEIETKQTYTLYSEGYFCKTTQLLFFYSTLTTFLNLCEIVKVTYKLERMSGTSHKLSGK